MSGGLVGLLDDIAALAKLAAASIDDIGAAAAKASVKAAGVVIDDTAVTPAYVQGLAAEREYPIIKRIALGSLKNKIFFILPTALLLSQFAPKLVEVILMCGGAYLCYEGAHKIHHRLTHDKDDSETEMPAAAVGPEAEEATVAGAIRTDFILSAEIMVIALKDVIKRPLVSRALILVLVAVVITFLVYGVVLLIVKMDDLGLKMIQQKNAGSQRIGRSLVVGMPKVLAVLSTVGTAAMLWVGGHILYVGANTLGWHGPYSVIHSLEDAAHKVGGVGGVLGWFANTIASAILGLTVGLAIVFAKAKLTKGPAKAH
jgi:uncharacterized protein